MIRPGERSRSVPPYRVQQTAHTRALIGSRVVRPLLAIVSMAWRVLAEWEAILWGAAVVGAGLIVGLRYEIGQNGDGLLLSLMSLQHLSFFFWGQDRFANLVPWLASAVHDPMANAQIQLAIRIGFGVAAPLLFCAPVGRPGDRFGACGVTLLATALALAFMPQRFVFEWFIEASPYGTSFALGGLAVLSFDADAGRVRWGSQIEFRVCGLVLVFAAYAVNASMVTLTEPMFLLLATASVRRGNANSTPAASVSGVGVTLDAATTDVDVKVTSMRDAETMVGLIAITTQVFTGDRAGFSWPRSLCLVRGVPVGLHVRRTFHLALVHDRAFMQVTRIGACHQPDGAVFVGVSLSSCVVTNFLHPAVHCSRCSV